MTPTRILYLALIAAAFIPRPARAGVVEHVSLTALCEKNGYTWTWNAPAGKLTCRAGNTVIVFHQDNHFYSINDTLFQLPVAPARRQESLYLPASLAAPLFEPGAVGAPQTASASGAPAADVQPAASGGAQPVPSDSADAYRLTALSVKEAGGKTVVTMGFSREPVMSFAFMFPNLMFSFQQAQTGVLSSAGLKKGLVDTVTVAAENGGVMVAIRLAGSVDQPQLATSENGTVLTVTLAPGRTEPKAGDERKNAPAGPSGTIRTVVIDPGHGGKDPGALGPGGVQEKDIVLKVGLALRDILKKKTDLTVHMTRSTDVFVPLTSRTKFANDKKADIFISIHANSIPGKDRRNQTRGYKVFFLSEAKNEEDKLVAMQENAVIELEGAKNVGDNLQNILIDMVNNEYLKESEDLSIGIAESFNATVGRIPRLHLGVGQAPFWVLNGAFMPSVLVEIGFISNPAEEALLKEPAQQKLIAEAVCTAIIGFRDRYEGGR